MALDKKRHLQKREKRAQPNRPLCFSQTLAFRHPSISDNRHGAFSLFIPKGIFISCSHAFFMNIKLTHPLQHAILISEGPLVNINNIL